MPPTRKRFVKKRKYTKKRMGVYSGSKSATVRSGAYLKGLGTRPELKAVDTTVATFYPSSATLQTVTPNVMVAGTGTWNRIGKKVSMKSIEFRWAWMMNPIAAPSNPTPTVTARMVLVYDRQPTGTAPIGSDLFQGVAQNSATSTTIYSPKNQFNTERFIYLVDRIFQMPGNYGIAGHGNAQWYQIDDDFTQVQFVKEIGPFKCLTNQIRCARWDWSSYKSF